MSWSRLARPTALGMAASIAILGIVDLVQTLTLSPAVPAFDATLAANVAPAIPALATGAIASMLALRRPANPAGWLLGFFVVSQEIGGVESNYLFDALYSGTPHPLAVPVGLLGITLGGGGGFLALIALLVVFPDGRLLSRRWRVALGLIITLGVLGSVFSILDPHALGDGHRQLANPLAIPSAQRFLTAMNSTVGSLAVFALFGVAIVAMIVRYRRSGPEVRQQVKWVGAGALILVAAVIVGISTSTTTSWTTPVPITAEIIGFSALPICIAVAVLKYRLYDLDLVVNRALVYGALAAFITAIYVGIVVGIGTLIGSGSRPNIALSILATAVVAVGFQPARERLQRLANRVVYGRRATPYEVLSEFAGRVAETYAADDVLPRMAKVLADGTGAASATVWLRAGQRLLPAATYPDGHNGHTPVQVVGQLMPALPDALNAVPVRHQGELLGALAVQKRAGESLSPIEEKLLDDLANQAGLVLKNVGLTADLEARLEELHASRQRLVKAQDEERRRLERNLHDGAQQNLVALKVRLGLAKGLVRKSPEKTSDLLQQLKAETDETLETLRDLARGIYPPLLADKGLVAALEGQARKATVPVSVEAEGVGRYPQDTEAAVYFCCLEALQNVQKYAGASEAAVRLSVQDDKLTFEVTDNGRGFDPASTTPGSGLTNMADRIDALGGSLVLESHPTQGTSVRAQVPVMVAAPS